VVVVLVTAGCSKGKRICLYQGEDGLGYLRIERLPDPHIVPTPTKSLTVDTKTGTRELVRVSNGDCNTVVDDLLSKSGHPGATRLVVETKDQAWYSILLDHKFDPTMQTVTKITEVLELEIVPARRPMLAYLIRANDEVRTGIEPYQGRPKWPEAREPRKLNRFGETELVYGKLVPREIMSFPSGGILFIRRGFDDDHSISKDDNLYFDGVSLDDLAKYVEHARGSVPVVNQTGDENLYSFSLPDGFEKQFSFDKEVPLPGLGISVTSGKVEMDVILVRDKQVKDAEESAEETEQQTPGSMDDSPE
jgi:hypothetical protein